MALARGFCANTPSESASIPTSRFTTARFRRPDGSGSARTRHLRSHEEPLSRRKATCLAIYSRAVNAESPLDGRARRPFPWCAAHGSELQSLFDAYVEAKQRQHVLDYDDLLLYWAAMMRDPALRGRIGGRFDHVLVDEYQDTNRFRRRSAGAEAGRQRCDSRR